MNLRSLILIFGITGLFGCGGGGGGSDAASGPLTDACSLLKPKILSGTACDNASSTPIARLTVQNGSEDQFLCSGTLIASRFVLTAGHCIPTGTFANQRFVASFGDLQIPVIREVRHPKYQETQNEDVVFFDVGVYELAADVPIAPVPIAASVTPAAGDIISIFGYGVDDSNNFGVLKSGQMRLTQVTPDHLFALYGNEGSNTCSGDSGGPATVEINGEAAVIGVTSSGTTENCVIGDNSSFANLKNPETLGFLQSVVGSGLTIR